MEYKNTDFDWWGNWGVYVCNIATSGGQIATQLHKVSLLDDQYSFLNDVALQVDQLYPTEDSFGAGKCRLWGELEALGLGMDMRSVKENITNPKIREKAACILEDYANRLKKVAQIMEGII